MEKGKKQHNSQENLLLCLATQGSRVVVSDQDYLALGSLFEGGRVRSVGRDLVLVDPAVPVKPRLSFRRTPLGMLAPTVLGALGKERELMEAVLANARPRCGTCHVPTERAEGINPAAWPQVGYVALVVDGVSEEVPLKEQCELLGAERALVAGTLVRVDDLDGLSGEPVLALAEASRRDDLHHEITSWLNRGAGALRLVHFSARDAQGVDIQRVSRRWRCASCGSTFPVATRQLVEDAAPCARCRGEGWLLVEDDRFVACEDCDAFGCVTPVASYEHAGFPLRHLARQSINDVVNALPASAGQRFYEIARSVIGEYPCGAAVELLSKGERARIAIFSSGLSRFSGLTLVVDGGVVDASGEGLEMLLPSDSECHVVAFAPSVESRDGCAASSAEGAVITLRDLSVGPLSIASLEIQIGQASLVQGEIGSGKSLVLQEMARRFAKKKKYAHLAMWGGLQRARLVRVVDGYPARLGELLGIDSEVAAEMARLRGAQERGLSHDDFLPSRSKYLCGECGGDPIGDEECPSCQGALFHHRVGSVPVGSSTFTDIMRLPLSEMSKVLWANEKISLLVERLPEEVQRLSLAHASSALAPATRRFLTILAPLLDALDGKSSLAGELVMVDAPFGTSRSYQSLIIRCIRELEARGATIVCAGVPKALENIFASVIRLRFVDRASEGDEGVRHFDARMARRTSARSDK